MNSERTWRFRFNRLFLMLVGYTKVKVLQHQIEPSMLRTSQIILRSNVLHHHFYLPKVKIEVKNGNGVLKRPVSCLKYVHGTSLLSTPGQFGPV